MSADVRRFSRIALLAMGMMLVAMASAVRDVHAAGTDNKDARMLGLPAAVAPVNNPTTSAKVAAGKMLFFDRRLSGNGTISCASCHIPEQAYSDGRALAVGINGRAGSRKTPSLLNVAFESSEFWDGRRPTLESQALDPIFNSREHGLGNPRDLVNLLQHDAAYRHAFASILGKGGTPTVDDAARALASFERSLVAGGSRFDRYEYGGDSGALSAAEIRGLNLFRGRAQCTTCHTIGQADATFSDGQFHSLGIGFSKIEADLGVITTKVANATGHDLDRMILSDADVAELGRFNVTIDPTDIGKFKTPDLRNVALRAPYMHDGSVATLQDAVDREVYYRGVEANHPLILTPSERMDIVEFLKALNSPYAFAYVPAKHVDHVK